MRKPLVIFFVLFVFFGVVPFTTAFSSSDYIVVFSNEDDLPKYYQDVIYLSGGQIRKEYPRIGAVKVNSDDPDFLAKVSSFIGVESAGIPNVIVPEDIDLLPVEAVNISSLDSGGHDMYELFQWDIKQVTGNGESWRLSEGMGKTYEGQDIVIAVVDTGIDYTHPDLEGNYLYGHSFVEGETDPIDRSGHGTMVAGMIAANGRVLGVGPNLKVASYKVFNHENEATSFEIAEAVVHAADANVDVINLSLGGYIWVKNPKQDVQDNMAEMKLVDRAIKYAIKKGVVVVNSAGNEGLDTSSPAKLTKALHGENARGATFRIPNNEKMIIVSAGTINEKKATYSNYGKAIDVMAPGGDTGGRCVSTSLDGGYASGVGTSLAVPKVSALAGVIIAKHGKDRLKPVEVERLLLRSAKDVLQRGIDKESGYGLIDAVKALNQR